MGQCEVDKLDKNIPVTRRW